MNFAGASAVMAGPVAEPAVSPERPVRTGLSLKTRIASALVLIPFVLAAIYAGGWVFLALLVIVAWILSGEWARVMAPDNPRFFTLATAGAVTAALILTLFGFVVPAIVVLLAGAVTVGVMAWGGKQKARWLAMGVLYIGCALVASEWIREAMAPPDGRNIIYWLLFVIWATDTGALAAGAWLGGPKLAPDISPRKTWSGAVGGMIAAMIVAGIATPWLFHVPMQAGLFLGAGASVIGQVGDLLESGIKRRFGIKDFGTVIPGHGGAFDRLDSLLLLMPFAAGGSVILMGADLW